MLSVLIDYRHDFFDMAEVVLSHELLMERVTEPPVLVSMACTVSADTASGQVAAWNLAGQTFIVGYNGM